VLLGLLSVAAGCGDDSSAAQYTPEEDQARIALENVLNEWQQGKEPGPIQGDPPIHLADTQRRKGQTLKSYEVLGELPADAGRRFQVKLSLDNPQAEEKVQFLVVGDNPLWVFRQEDYDFLTHWDHPMPQPGAKP
jgi:hypothetical protein